MAGFPGFECSGFPGIAVLGWLKAHTNFTWCGFYLGPAPSHPDDGWMPHRAEIAALGFGIAPLYVGEQTVGAHSSKLSSGPKGTQDGIHAAGLLHQAGFAPGTFVYLDLENGAPFADVQHAYVGAWADAVTAAGFGTGVYCSHQIAMEVHTLRPQARIWAYKVPTTDKHGVPGTNFPDPHPSGSGFPSAFIWQLDQSAVIGAGPNQTLLVDLDSAIAPDPGR